MKTIKFKYIFSDGKEFKSTVLSLAAIESGALKSFTNNIPCSFKLIATCQFTGFTDKLNRNEIYNHDIINHMKYGFIKVEWNYKDSGWVCITKTFKKIWLVDILLQGGIRVGNIYENKELLEIEK